MVLGLPGGGRAECGPLPVITPVDGLIEGSLNRNFRQYGQLKSRVD